MICLSIEDEGIGIPKEMQHMIFERFGQADTVLSRQAEGTGLGLHLVKLIVESLDGEILLESEEGKGSKFTVYLPLTNKLDQAMILENIRSINEDTARIDQAVSIEFSDVYFNR